MDAFQFIKDVAVDWDDSKYLERAGKFITVARNAKGLRQLVLGSVNGDSARTSNIPSTSFPREKSIPPPSMPTDPHRTYKTNPQAYNIPKQIVTRESRLRQWCAPGGGYAISLFEVK